MFGLFKTEITDEKIFKQLGKKCYIRNGVGYGFISSEDLYHNCHIEIGIGRTTSGYGDWGGGFDRATTSPLKIVIDKDYNIIKTETDSFYNSKDSKEVEQLAKKLQAKLGKKFIVKNEFLKECIDTIFKAMPIKSHIGLDADFEEEKTPHMLEYFTNKERQQQYDFVNPKCLSAVGEKV